MNSEPTELPRPHRYTAYGRWLGHALPGEEIVISGMAGHFPEADGIDEYYDNLINKVDMVTDDERRWRKRFYATPQRTGKVKSAEFFDAPFFDRCFHEAHAMDPSCRLLLERSYEAVIDAGVSPMSLEGKRLGVYLGVCYSETENVVAVRNDSNWGLRTFSRAIMPGMITRAFKAVGPAYIVDTACSSVMAALDEAFHAMRRGSIDAAIVGGSTMLLLPRMSHLFYLLGVLSPSGSSKPFDERGDGYARSEGAVVVYLQRASDAKRIYATVAHTLSNCDGFKDMGITFPSEIMQKDLMSQAVSEADIFPGDMDYVEAHGTGTKAGDPVEMRSIDHVFGEHFTRDKPLLIGSVKSNVGHAEAVSGFCSLVKVILAMERGVIPPNIHYEKPKPDLIPLIEKRFKVVTEPTTWACKTVSINNFGFGGANSLVLLRWNPKAKAEGCSSANGLPRLVLASGRSARAVEKLFQHTCKQTPVDVELVSLYNHAFAQHIPGHVSKGYQVIGSESSTSACIQTTSSNPPKIWFLLHGATSVRPGVARELMKIPVFASTIAICNDITKRVGVDLEMMLTSDAAKISTTVQNIMSLVALQIALVDVLKEVGVQAEGFVGWGVGELACAYADGCLSPQKALLGAYVAAAAMQHPSVPPATNALVDYPAHELINVLPKGVYISTICSVSCCTITGPKDIMKNIMALLTSRGVSVRELHWPNVPFNTPYLSRGIKAVQNIWKQVIHLFESKPSKWRSASGDSVLLSIEHLLDTIQQPADTSRVFLDVPHDALLVDICPDRWVSQLASHGNFHGTTTVPLLCSDCANPFENILHALGRLYVSGVPIETSPLYSDVQFPVGRGTTIISPAITWDHSVPWKVHGDHLNHLGIFSKNIRYHLATSEDKYLLGHVVDGRALFPATGYLFMMVEFIGKCMDYSANKYMVIFENVKLERATPVREDGIVEFHVIVHKESGQFEIMEGGASIVTGTMKYQLAGENTLLCPFQQPPEVLGLRMGTNDIYKELRLRGYSYRETFRGIESANTEGTSAMIKWLGNYVIFMDNMLQLKILSLDTRNLYIPVSIEKFAIDLRAHDRMVQDLGENKVLPVYYDMNTDTLRGGGVEIKGMNAVPIPRKKDSTAPVLMGYSFVPLSSPGLDAKDMLAVCFHLYIENTFATTVKILEIAGEKHPLLANDIVTIFSDIPFTQHDVTVVASPDCPNIGSLEPDVKRCSELISAEKEHSVIIASDLLTSNERTKSLISALHDEGYIFTRERTQDTSALKEIGLQVISEQVLHGEIIMIMKKVSEKKSEKEVAIRVTGENFDWVSELQQALLSANAKVIIYSQGESDSGILGLYTSLTREGYERRVRCFFILDGEAPKFDIHHPFYHEQLQKNLAVNIFQYGTWGTFRYLRLDAVSPKKFRHVYSNVTSIGDLSTLTWQQGPLDSRLGDGKVDITQVKYAALNFRDIMVATGRLSVDVLEKRRLEQECVLGLEYSGYTESGERVMGLTTRGGLATLVERSQAWEWPVPEKWTLAEAASVPMTYLTVVYAFRQGRLKRNERVLIHAGSGGVGQAAINYCLFHGCTVFTTVGTPEKRDFLLKRFPKLAPGHIGNSRDTSFEQMVLRGTGGCGVDLVLNSLAGDKLQASVRCLAPGGRFLEIGKFDLTQNSMLAMSMFETGKSFHGIHLDEHLQDPTLSRKMFTTLLQRAIDEGSVVPLSQNVFSSDQVEKAFRFMANGKHIGKVLIKISEDQINTKNFFMGGYAKVYCNHQSSYIIVGGLGGFGLEFADWLIMRGARKLILVSTNGIVRGYQASRVSTWRKYGVKVVVDSADIGTLSGVEQLIAKAAQLGPVDGIFNTAVVWRDALFEDQTPETFAESAKPKAVASRLLDEASRRLCPSLRYFVVFSSMVAGIGNAGQTNYGFSNSAMERICEARVRDGLPGLAIQWSAVSEVGLFDDKEEDETIVVCGSHSQRVSACLRCLDSIMFSGSPVVCTMLVAEKGTSSKTDIILTISNILGIRDIKTVQESSKLSELGMDSMMSVEIKQAVEQRFEIFFTPQDIRNMTIKKLMELEEALLHKGEITEVGSTNNEVEGDNFTKMMYGDQSTANRPVLVLDSLASSAASSAMTVFALPGTDGAAIELTPITRNVKAAVLGLQFAYSEKCSIPEIAQDLVQEMLPHLRPNQRINLMGYSYGGVVAMEALLILEAAGYEGNLILIDSSPIYAKRLLINYFNLLQNDCDFAVQNKILRRLFLNSSQKMYANVDKLMIYLDKTDSWEDRIRYFLQVMKVSESSVDDLVLRIKAVHILVVACLKYEWAEGKRIHSPVILIRANKSSKATLEDYGLREFCSKDVEQYFVEGDHVTMVSNPAVADIINSHLV